MPSRPTVSCPWCDADVAPRGIFWHALCCRLCEITRRSLSTNEQEYPKRVVGSLASADRLLREQNGSAAAAAELLHLHSPQELLEDILRVMGDVLREGLEVPTNLLFFGLKMVSRLVLERGLASTQRTMAKCLEGLPGVTVPTLVETLYARDPTSATAMFSSTLMFHQQRSGTAAAFDAASAAFILPAALRAGGPKMHSELGLIALELALADYRDKKVVPTAPHQVQLANIFSVALLQQLDRTTHTLLVPQSRRRVPAQEIVDLMWEITAASHDVAFPVWAARWLEVYAFEKVMAQEQRRKEPLRQRVWPNGQPFSVKETCVKLLERPDVHALWMVLRHYAPLMADDERVVVTSVFGAMPVGKAKLIELHDSKMPSPALLYGRK